MLFFYAAEEDQLPTLRRTGTPEGATLFASLEEARREGGGPVLAISAEAHPKLASAGTEQAPFVPALPPSAFENLNPYCPPEPVTAGGGYVLRAEERSQHSNRQPPRRSARAVGAPLAARRLLLIHRRGVWDLPKGKQDPGEAVRACALREVREETGLSRVQLLGALGPTVHGYHEDMSAGPRYCVKTTHWFLMLTEETDLTPERQEGIEEAAWVPWKEAGARLGYETLRRHHDRAEARARALLEDRAGKSS